MNGRSYSAAATAVDRTPSSVLAWNVEPTQFSAGTYPEMPAAAAAAVSPVVPASSAAAAPPDPYGRCWQTQVDPSACFPYFGSLYGSSLPPPSYRMQPGCLSNLGQFWPPTPPPEGCVRYDGTNNLHYCSPLTPVFRHGESLPQNMLGVQRLSHYSHLIDMNKDAGLKRVDTSLDTMQRQKVLLSAKHSKEPQQRTCSCYECNEKCYSRGTTHSVNKENTNRLLEQKYSEDKFKSKSCRKAKDDNYPHSRSSMVYHPNASAINSYNCSMDSSLTRTTPVIHSSNHLDYMSPQSSQKLENQVSANHCAQHEFLRPESNTSYHGSRCTSSSLMTTTSIKDSVQQMAHSTLKPSEHSRFEIPVDKTRHKAYHVSAPVPDPCPVQTPSSSISHRLTDNSSCCFSPPYVSSKTVYHNYPESSPHSKTPNMLMMYGNGYNASPLKNVYFSYYESENFDTGSGTTNKKSKNSISKIDKSSSMNSLASQPATPVSNQSSYGILPVNNQLINSKFIHPNLYDSATVPRDTYGCVYPTACVEQQKVSNSNHGTFLKQYDTSVLPDHMPKLTPVRIKKEKVENSDCKYQSPRHNSDSRLCAVPNSIQTGGVLNLSTSIRCPKIEPSDPSAISDGEAITSIMTSVPPATTFTTVQSVSAKLSQGLDSRYYPGMSAVGSMLQCHQVPDATTPQMHELASDCAPAVPEDLCPEPQIAPCGGAELAIMGKMPTTGYEAPVQVACRAEEPEENTGSRRTRNSASVHYFPEEPLHVKNECQNTATYNQDASCSSSIVEANIPIEEPSTIVSSAAEDSYKPKENSTLSRIEHEDINSTSAFSNIKLEHGEGYSSVASLEDPTEDNQQKSEPILDETEKTTTDALPEVTLEIPKDTPDEECHGLYVLLQGIDHKTNVGSTGKPDNCVIDKKESDVKTADKSSMKGLNLLCALVEEQFMTEFSVKQETDENEKLPSSNYPLVKEEENSDANNSAEDSNETLNDGNVTSELKLRKRLAELQQIYKEKQKELARLKPKKISSSDGAYSSLSSSSFLKEVASDDNSSKIALLSSGPYAQKTAKVRRASADEALSARSVMQMDAITKLLHSEEKCTPKSRGKTVLKRLERRTIRRRRAESKHALSRSKSKSSANEKTPSKSSPTKTSESDLGDDTRKIKKQQKKFSKHKGSSMRKKQLQEPRFEEFEHPEEIETINAQTSKSPKKRKAENPKKFMPSKQIRLTETIVTKQLRNRILLDASDGFSEKSEEKPYDVPEALFDALRKCHLGESTNEDDSDHAENIEVVSPTMPLLIPEAVDVVRSTKNADKHLKMTVDKLVENNRILAIEEGLFYAGIIRDIQSNSIYAVVLDGQRGNKKHLFTKEEMITQTFPEVKPVTLSELPEGTRVCAYWSHQYRCLYPGVVVKAPTPSVDWSEPRVFVEFDDGDSAQIAMKNIRFLPSDLVISSDDEAKDAISGTPFGSKDGDNSSDSCTSRSERKTKKRKADIPNNTNDLCSNETNTTECSTTKCLISPSQRLEQEKSENMLDFKVSKRRQTSKQKSGSKTKVKDGSLSPEKPKKHKKYKERHKHHHHHRHHHHHHSHHCHHRHHCKKRKHHKRDSSEDNIINVVIPSNSIPFSNLVAKATRSSKKDVEAQCESKKENKKLPQPNGDMGNSKSSVKERGTSKKLNGLSSR